VIGNVTKGGSGLFGWRLLWHFVREAKDTFPSKQCRFAALGGAWRMWALFMDKVDLRQQARRTQEPDCGLILLRVTSGGLPLRLQRRSSFEDEAAF